MIAVTQFHVPEWGTMSLIEFIWTLSGLFTVYFCGVQLERAHQRFLDVIASGRNGPMKALAHAYRRREALRLMQGVVITGIGVYASATVGLPYITWVGILITVGLMFVGGLAVLQSLLDAKTAHHVTELLLDEMRGKR